MITVRHSLINCMQRGSMISSLRALGKRRMEGININGEEKQIKNANYTRTHRISWARNIVIYWIRRLSVIRGVEVWSCLSLVKHSHLFQVAIYTFSNSMIWCGFLQQQETEHNNSEGLLQAYILGHPWAWKSDWCWLLWVFVPTAWQRDIPNCVYTDCSQDSSLAKKSWPMPIRIVTRSVGGRCYNATKDTGWLVSIVLLNPPASERNQACNPTQSLFRCRSVTILKLVISIYLHFSLAHLSVLSFSALV